MGDQALGDRLRIARGTMTTEELADRVAHVLGGKGRKASISEWEGGKSPRPVALAAIAKVTGVDGHWLLTGEGDPRAAGPEAGERLRRIREILDEPGYSTR